MNSSESYLRTVAHSKLERAKSYECPLESGRIDSVQNPPLYTPDWLLLGFKGSRENTARRSAHKPPPPLDDAEETTSAFCLRRKEKRIVQNVTGPVHPLQKYIPKKLLKEAAMHARRERPAFRGCTRSHRIVAIHLFQAFSQSAFGRKSVRTRRQFSSADGPLDRARGVASGSRSLSSGHLRVSLKT
ncbi:hypothetical protein Trydic_g23881 [Trypoxylus dichotomus]